MTIERFLTQDDATTLSRLAEHMLRVGGGKLHFGENLLDLISSATLLPDDTERTDCIALHSRVTYRAIGSEGQRAMHIVCPEAADDTMDYVSILAPLAMSLIGRPKHSVIEVHLPFNQIQFIEILEVQAPVRGSRTSVTGKGVASGQETQL